MDLALAGISAAFFIRVMILENRNALLDLILPFMITCFIAIVFVINKKSKSFAKYFHAIVTPLVGLLTAQKTLTQNREHFYINESFASWLLLMIFGGFSSSM